VLYDGEQEKEAKSLYLGPELHTNNYAEYMGLTYLLRWLDEHGIKNVEIFSDSKVVVGQVNQTMVINKSELRVLASIAYFLLVRGRHKLIHVKGHDGNKGNERADRLCNEELDKAGIPRS